MNKQELLTNGRCKKKADRETVWPVVIMNFTGVYAHEVFARNFEASSAEHSGYCLESV